MSALAELKAKRYHVFHRTWWKRAERPGWPNDREPHMGEKTYIAHNVGWKSARALCEEYNSSHDPADE